jgi:monoamine oxidase
MNDTYPLDLAIIGGGVSGVYLGWRLRTDDPSRSVGLFESSRRIGGRLISVVPPELDGFKAELGGMRFLTNQTHVPKLIAELGLETRPFPVGQDDNIYYLRGAHLRQEEFDEPKKVPYRLSWQERGKSPGALIAEAIDTILPGASKLTTEQWVDVKKNYIFDGRPLYMQGFWNLLATVMSSEAYDLVLNAGGYATAIDNWNAAEALHWFLSDFGPEVEYRTIVDGMERLPRELAARFEGAGGEVHIDHKLVHFARVAGEDGDVFYNLYFENRPAVAARRVVLAMPRRALELLDQDGEFFTPEVKALMRTVTPHPMFKLFLAYRYPWWREAGVSMGRSVTDLPLRQVYYFGVEPEGQVAFTPEIRDSLLMASYDDGRHVGFWRGLAPDEPMPPDDDPFESPERWNSYAAPKQMIEHAQRQLKLVHDIEYIPQPYAAAFADWGRDPFGGAWNSWDIGVKAWEVGPRMLQPREDWEVYVCGEAYSPAQGWVEGALATAEIAFEKLEL